MMTLEEVLALAQVNARLMRAITDLEEENAKLRAELETKEHQES